MPRCCGQFGPFKAGCGTLVLIGVGVMISVASTFPIYHCEVNPMFLELLRTATHHADVTVQDEVEIAHAALNGRDFVTSPLCHLEIAGVQLLLLLINLSIMTCYGVTRNCRTSAGYRCCIEDDAPDYGNIGLNSFSLQSMKAADQDEQVRFMTALMKTIQHRRRANATAKEVQLGALGGDVISGDGAVGGLLARPLLGDLDSVEAGGASAAVAIVPAAGAGAHGEVEAIADDAKVSRGAEATEEQPISCGEYFVAYWSQKEVRQFYLKVLLVVLITAGVTNSVLALFEDAKPATAGELLSEIGLWGQCSRKCMSNASETNAVAGASLAEAVTHCEQC